LDAAEVAVLVRAAESRGALPVVTAKDAIKLPPESLQAVAWLEVEARIVTGDLGHLIGQASGRPGAAIP
ncbi:MAG: hypothetical protein ACOY3Y_10205, partial [Acidobacteriota bacterium]